MRAIVAACFAWALSTVPAAADVTVALADGTVTISAKNATVSQILSEWARVGNTRIVNGERVTGAPLTLELTKVSEAQALDIVLRSAGGYLLAPRQAPSPTASRYDRIFIIPTSSPVRPAPVAATAPRAAFSQPRVTPAAQPRTDDDGPEPPDVAPPPQPVATPRPPAFETFPRPQPAAAPAATPPPSLPTSRPTAPVGVAVPGMPTPVPQPPGERPR